MLRSRGGWLAAELMVVVIGVLIALGTDGWREDRQRSQEESFYLDRLSEDLDATLSSLRGALNRLGRMSEATLKLIELQEDAATQASVDADSLAALYIRATDADFVPSMVGRGSTYRELVASGRLELISDRELRSRLVFFNTGVDGLGQTLSDMYDGGLRDRIAGLTGYRPYRLTSATLLSVPGVGLSEQNRTRLLDAMRVSPPSVVDLRRMHADLDDQGVVVEGLILGAEPVREILERARGSF